MVANTIHAFASPIHRQSQIAKSARKSRLVARSESQDIIVKGPPEERQEELESEGRCKTCGVPKNEIPWGCNQEGRVAGGLGAVVGFEWWPIKAYKPCGKAAKAGVLYTRKGQITDEMLFGPRDQQ